MVTGKQTQNATERIKLESIIDKLRMEASLYSSRTKNRTNCSHSIKEEEGKGKVFAGTREESLADILFPTVIR